MMFDYEQPDFYRFSVDSILLAKIGYDFFKQNGLEKVEKVNLIDAFSGCGVVGIEFLLLSPYFKNIKNVYFIEKNKEMLKFCKKNIEKFKTDFSPTFNLLEDDFFTCNLKKLESDCSYNFFLMNPPYFLSNEKKSPKNTHRKMARFFSDGISLADIFQKLDRLSLNNNIFGAVLYRRDQVREGDIFEINKSLKNGKIFKQENSDFHKLTGILFFKS